MDNRKQEPDIPGGHTETEVVSDIICRNYKKLISKYWKYTASGKEHFEHRTFKKMFRKAQKRYNLYGRMVHLTLEELRERLGDRLGDAAGWKKYKAGYSGLISHRMDKYIAETFFNSITRKVFNTEGFNPEIEFVDFSDFGEMETREVHIYETISSGKLTPVHFEQLLNYYRWAVPFEDIKRDAGYIYERIVPYVIFHKGGLHFDRIEFLKMAFYRNKGAFIIGRILYRKWQVPFVIPILNDAERGLYADTVLYTASEISILFSFTRASFFAETRKPVELVNFLHDLIPHKSLGELYDSIGLYRHGKTLLYRDIYRYIDQHDDQFVIAPGIKGMVMSVFTLRHYNFVFKVIRDSFDQPKNVTREQVIQKYRDVELSDRVGRLIYAHKFEFLSFDKSDFTAELLDELKGRAAETIDIREDKVVLKHVYIERRLMPLNLYLATATIVEACAAMIDYGHAVKEMAMANIFPGDLLLKNFGVTRHGRIIFYDYDEIQWLTDINFRRIPPPRSDHDEFSADPWFSVGPNDVFPEEFKSFMVPKGSVGNVFMEVHGELFNPAYWRGIQENIRNGKLLEFYSYDEKTRFGS